MKPLQPAPVGARHGFHGEPCFNAVDLLKPHYHHTHTFKNPSFTAFKKQLTQLLEESPNGVIIATLHYGNWELLSAFTSFHSIEMTSIARAQKNRLTNAYLDGLRSRSHMEVIAHDDAQLFRKIAGRLKEGRVLGILPDIRNDATETSFFFRSTNHARCGLRSLCANSTSAHPARAHQAIWLDTTRSPLLIRSGQTPRWIKNRITCA